MENNLPLLKIENLDFSYQDSRVVFSNLNFSAAEKDFIGIIGPNGGGKTTFFKLILGTLRPKKGEIYYKGNPINQRRPNIGYVPQSLYNVDKYFPVTVLEVVLSGFLLKKHMFRGYNREEIKKAEFALGQVDMADFKRQHIGQLSGGQFQRVFLARAIVAECELLLLDEPTANIDISFEIEFFNILQKLNQKMAIMLVSHKISSMVHYANKIACVKNSIHTHEPKALSYELLHKTFGCPVEIFAETRFVP